MYTGSETWKWTLVFILLAVFLIVVNQAYQHVAGQEHYEPPDDYLKGDSWDLEHNSGPGAGQAVQLSPMSSADPLPVKNLVTKEDESAPIVIEDDIDWNQVDTPNKE